VGPNSGVNTSVGLSGCVLIGNEAGALNTTDNRLMIDNTTTTEPLIDGDFAGDTLQLNATTTVGKTGDTTVHGINTPVVAVSADPSTTAINISLNGTTYKLHLFPDT